MTCADAEALPNGNGSVTAKALLRIVRQGLERLQSNEFENAEFIAGLANILSELDQGQGRDLIAGMDSPHRQAQDSAAPRSTFMDRFPEAQSIQLGMATAAMRVR